jgi:PAS domain S-box-containing protein
MNFLSNWFQYGPVSEHTISGNYDWSLVLLSYVVAVMASFVTLTLAGQLRSETNQHARKYWLVGGAFTMGAGIWSMHFIGMLAFSLPMPMGYEFDWTMGSLLMAVLASAIALFILQKKYSTFHLALGGLFIGLGICTMHYMGMQGMKTHVDIHYIPSIFFLSIAIAIGAAEAALWLAVESNKGSAKHQLYFKVISALVMGVAICGMHYTAMSASIFSTRTTHMMLDNEVIPPNYLAFFIAGITGLIIGLALTVSSYYKKIITAVQNEQQFLNAMLDNLEDGIIACDETGQITVINHALQKYVQLSKQKTSVNDLPNYYELFTEDNKPVHKDEYPTQKILHGEKIQNLPLTIKFKNGTQLDIVMDGQPIINKEGKNLGAVMVVHDVTELKRTEKLKNEFVSIVSHELRTPLTSIRGSLGLLVSGVMGDFNEKANKLLEIANNNCERLLLLINDILDIEKIEAGKMDFKLKTLDLKQLTKESIEANKMYAEKFKTSLQFVDPDIDLFVRVDEARLMQVLANLISNACKFSPPNRPVTVEIKRIKNKVRVSVSDKGPGIPLEFQERIFQKFSQADSSDSRGKGGTGLGLNISKSIVEKMGGILSFVSLPNEGSTFYFELPLIKAEKTEDQIILQKPITKRRLLVVEDDEAQAQYLKALLESAGFNVDLAFTAAQARQQLSEHVYHALLLDLILPDQDGIAFIRELRAHEKTSNLHIVVLSVIAKTGKSILNGDAVSIIDWFEKPVDMKQLLTAINRIRKEDDKPPVILHVEDNKDTQHVVTILLENHAELHIAGSLKQAKEKINQRNYDLIILDLLLPDGNGVELLPLIAKSNTPVLVFSETQLNQQYAQYVSQALIKSNSTNEELLNTIMTLV